MTSTAASLRGRYGAALRHHPDDVETATQLRREHDVERLHEHIRRVVEAAPPLTSEQAAKLRHLLPPVGPT